MERQKDWFTGINYYDNYLENQIIVEQRKILQPTQMHMNERVEMIYIMGGKGDFLVNGVLYPVKRGSFLCLYSHHFHSVSTVEEEISLITVQFYIGLFMHMCWEKHPKNANERLVYETCPMVYLKEGNRDDIESLFKKICKEKREQRFESGNLIEYMTLELHAYHCRYVFENIGREEKSEELIWNIIKQVILTTQDKLSIVELAEQVGCSKRVLNQRIKEKCGYTFFQLQMYGKIINACALLHFSELSLEYISDLLGFSSISAFYRVFTQYASMTPRDYQKKYVGNLNMVKSKTGLVLQFLQYMHLHFMHDISLLSLCTEFCIKEYTAKQMIGEAFGRSFQEIMTEIRISYACSFLSSTNESVLSISNRCGFNSLSTFQRAFYQYMNQTPKSFRELSMLSKK